MSKTLKMILVGAGSRGTRYATIASSEAPNAFPKRHSRVLSKSERSSSPLRTSSANPARVTASLAGKLSRSKKVWVNTQFNCADEVTPEARAAAARLVDRGVPVSCQTVLLKGVNDSPTEMLRLLRALSAARIRPYYVFMCDPVAGVGRFRVPLERARRIERICAESIGGLSMPRFVADIPGAKRKQPI